MTKSMHFAGRVWENKTIKRLIVFRDLWSCYKCAKIDSADKHCKHSMTYEWYQKINGNVKCGESISRALFVNSKSTKRPRPAPTSLKVRRPKVNKKALAKRPRSS